MSILLDLETIDPIGRNNDSEKEINVKYTEILALILCSNLWTFLLTTIPVVSNIPPSTYYAGHPNWYTGDDVMRFIEPVGGLLFNFSIFYKSGIFQKFHVKNNIKCISIFVFAIAIYEQGSAFHSASNMFKNALETITTNDDPKSAEYADLHYYMRTVWEHDVSHYLYASGLVVMNICQLYAFRNLKADRESISIIGKILLTLSSLVYGILIAGVSINFPSGLIVGLIYVIGFGFFVVGGYIYHQFKYERDSQVIDYCGRPIVQHFFLGYVWGFLLIILWIAANGGKLLSRSQSGN